MNRHAIREILSGRLEFAGPEAHHLLHVLRAKRGDELVVFDGQGREARARVKDIIGKTGRIILEVGTPQVVNRESPFNLTLAFALSKGDKPEWIVQKAVELGVSAMLVFQSARSVAIWRPEQVAGKVERLAATVRGACAQCGRNVIPPVSFASSLKEAARSVVADLRVFLVPEAGLSLAAAPAGGSFCLLTGPEGGLAPEEIALLSDSGWHPAGLGPRTLRAETATLAAVALLQGLHGDLAGSGTISTEA